MIPKALSKPRSKPPNPVPRIDLSLNRSPNTPVHFEGTMIIVSFLTFSFCSIVEADSGSWGAWSPWSACTSTCGGGTRNRYRFCDSPPPRYGAKFCEGSSLETMRCGPDNEWDCAPEGVSADLPLPLPPPAEGRRVAAGAAQGTAVNSGCRCGCVVHLGTTKPGTLLASSSKSCPGRSFWLVQVSAAN
ncbi:hypothetical protein FOCC_FOCC001759 [Frankliniella occidentalis]|nr:hypothetical protein FOCC_FOCC001759 [Frankliniella occidentalis]